MVETSRTFMGDDFLLDTPAASYLYHSHAAKMPVIDYHCHLSPQMIAENKPFASITELWLGGDHYKWRAMRANGVDERYITGDAPDDEKFIKWAETVPYTFRNPLYHWTHLELRTAFGISDILNGDNAREIYERCNSKLADPQMTPRGLMRRYNVETVCTTDDPVDSLEYHKAIADSGFEVKVLPTWRPDKALAVDDPEAYAGYLKRLSEVSGVEISGFDTLMDALRVRHDFFHESGCRLADHGLGKVICSECSRPVAEDLFAKVLSGESLSPENVDRLKSAILIELLKMNAGKGWVQQIHFGPLRNVNSRAARVLGPDTGFDTIGDFSGAEAMASLLDRLDRDGKLAKTILYNLNPSDNVWVAAMIANFQDGSCPGKIQMGSGWWFNDQIRGMEDQMNALSTQGLLSRFVGMLTDSRSFLSYPRHEYFRRVLCNLLGSDIDRGLIPVSELERIGQMVEDICYYNAKRYFNF
ncbi:MAG: glucuronate isomerase [Paramuribaculum sp.]|nr:glucuronate isomerase [Paramuribaculum sp.]